MSQGFIGVVKQKGSDWIKVKAKKLKRFVQRKIQDPELVIQTAISSIEETLARHKARLQGISLLIKDSLEKAKKEMQQGHKDEARHELRVKALYEEEAKSTRQEIYGLEKEKIQLNSVIRSHDTYQALRKSKQGMKYKLDELADVQEMIDEINDHKVVTENFNKILATEDSAENRTEELDLLQNDFK